MKSKPDGTQIEAVLQGEIPEDLLTSADGQTLYWSESGNNSVWKFQKGGATPVKIYQPGEAVRGLALDQDDLYVVQASGIYKMKTDGTQAALALAVTGANDLTLVNGALYWTGLSDGKIYKQNAAGTGGTAVYSDLSNPTNLLYNSADQRLYWREYCGASVCSGIRKGRADGTGKQNVINDFVEGFALDSAGAKLYCTYDIFDEIFSINTNGSGRATVADITSTPTDIVLFDGRFFWFDRAYGDYLYHSALDGSNQQVLASKSVYRPTRFVADTVQNWLYWINSPSSFQSDNSAAIQRARFDGTGVQNVVPAAKLDGPYDLAIDMVNQKLYWTDTGDGVIRRANADGTNVETIVSGLSAPVDLELDLVNNRLFWTDWSAKNIVRTDLSGAQKTVLVQNLNQPWGLAYDAAVDSLFFTNFGGRTIQRVSTQGGTADTLLAINDVFSQPNGICVDRANQVLYWSDQGRSTVSRLGLNGSGLEVVLEKADGLSTPSGVQIFPAGSVVKTVTPILLAANTYPNPCTSVLHISELAAGDQVALYDLNGRLVLEQGFQDAGVGQLNTASLAGGMYLLVLRRANGQLSVGKVLKQQ